MKNNFKSKVAEYPKPTGWLNFYVLWRFPIGFAISAFAIFSLLKDLLTINYGDLNVLLITLFLEIFLLIFSIFTYIEMKKLSKIGYILNFVFIIWAIFSNIIVTTINSPNPDFRTNGLWYNFLIYLVFYIIPNFNYFNRRKDLFYSDEKVKIEVADL
jgi:hypothetical protein